MACSYCYARRMYKRFKWSPELRLDLKCMTGLPKEPSRIFVGSTMELFGDWIPEWWLKLIFTMTQKWENYTFIFLTKKPEELLKWSPFPSNVWIGVSATSHNELANRWGIMRQIKASVKFVSLEPLLDWADISHRSIYAEGIINSGIQWLILGCQTPISKRTLPKREWVDEIISATNKAGIPVFVKEPMVSHFNIHKQEFPQDKMKIGII